MAQMARMGRRSERNSSVKSVKSVVKILLKGGARLRRAANPHTSYGSTQRVQNRPPLHFDWSLNFQPSTLNQLATTEDTEHTETDLSSPGFQCGRCVQWFPIRVHPCPSVVKILLRKTTFVGIVVRIPERMNRSQQEQTQKTEPGKNISFDSVTSCEIIF